MSERLPLLRYVEWEDVRRDNKYPATDNNNGLIYGIEWMNPDNREEVSDVEWFATEEERWEGDGAMCAYCGSLGHITADHDMPKTHTVRELLNAGWCGWDEYYMYEYNLTDKPWWRKEE